MAAQQPSDRPELPGSIAQEAARLVEALGTWARAVPGEAEKADGAPRGGPLEEREAGVQAAHQPAPFAQDRPAGGPATEPSDGPPQGRCPECGARTGAGRAKTCRVCPICQGMVLLGSVRPERVERLADLAGWAAASLRQAAEHLRYDQGEASAGRPAADPRPGRRPEHQPDGQPEDQAEGQPERGRADLPPPQADGGR